MSRCDAVVAELAGDHAWVELPARAPGCGQCSSPEGCGRDGHDGSKRRILLENRIGARVGDRVELEVRDGIVWRASLVSYGWPLLLAIAGAAAGQLVGNDALAVVGLLSGLTLGWLLLRKSERDVRSNPQLISLQFPIREIRFEDPK